MKQACLVHMLMSYTYADVISRPRLREDLVGRCHIRQIRPVWWLDLGFILSWAFFLFLCCLLFFNLGCSSFQLLRCWLELLSGMGSERLLIVYCTKYLSLNVTLFLFILLCRCYLSPSDIMRNQPHLLVIGTGSAFGYLVVSSFSVVGFLDTDLLSSL